MHGSNSKHMVSWMTLGDPITVVSKYYILINVRNSFKINKFIFHLVGILIFNKFIYKYLEGCNRETLIVTKFIIGMYFALFSMCAAGTVEIFRQDQCDSKQKKTSIIYLNKM